MRRRIHAERAREHVGERESESERARERDLQKAGAEGV
jgi:hypothetical protein